MSRYTRNPEYCIICGHVNTESCLCSNCVEMRARKVEQERAEKERRKEEKRLRIIKMYGNKTSPIDYNSLSLAEKIRIGVILFHTAGKTEFALNDYDFKMYPAYEEINILKQMFQKDILIISDAVDPDAFSDDLESCDFSRLRLQINVDIDKEEIERLLNGRISLSSKDFYFLWKYIAQLQLTEYLVVMMEKYNLSFSPGKTTETLLSDMLEHYSISRSMALIYSAITKACARYQAGGISRKHAANTVITICKDYLSRALDEGWTLKEFRRDYDIGISSAETYIYSFLLKIGEAGFKCSPGMMSDKLYEEIYLKKYQDDAHPE